jgi:N4-gp56 family major capsid protein
MTVGNTLYGDITPRIGKQLDAKALTHAEPVLCVQKMGQLRVIGKNKGQTLKARRARPFPLATTPITEGVKPATLKLEYEDVDIVIQQYGSISRFTDVVGDTHEDDVVNDLTQLSGEQAAETTEKITIGAIIGGTNAKFANGTVRASVNTALTLNLQRKCTRQLKANRATKITQVLGGSVLVSTKVVEAAFVAIAHTDMESSIRNLAGFVSVAEYGTRKTICDEEIGSVEDVRYVLTQNMTIFTDAGGAKGTHISTGGTNADVYPIIYMGKDAFCVTPLKGEESIHMKVLKAGKPSFGDELGQWGSVGWITWFAAKIINDAWLVRAEVAVPEL